MGRADRSGTFDEAGLRARLDRHDLRLTAVAPGGRALIAGVAEAVGHRSAATIGASQSVDASVAVGGR